MARPQRDDRLEGKVAIITGAGSRGDGIGNGRAAAVLLARHGARVALVDTDVDAAEETARLIAAEGGVTQIYDGDVSDRASCEAIVERTVEGFGRLDILVNNVGLTGPRGDAIEVDDLAWDSAMRVNVASMMLMAKYAIPEMIKSGGGSIINLTSIAGLRGGHPSLLYPTSKSAVIGLTRAMAAHHGRDGIRVNCIAPGTVYTPMVASRGMSDEMRKARAAGTLLGTEGTGWDIGYGVLFLASDEARWITGITLAIDGGASVGQTGSPVPPSEPLRH
ncbi:SDR family oxidoreductase [Tardiphaga sp. P9-11]|uniref:SDR family NAD(P)-dependent oxidoreductase n=1 Tax=Tardiphaga sp. P9-11 TaxID=2024614 RepID=UPI0011F26414|nr:SDR family oxidoreductase [Tardiphaga sp. P9-11]KAA0074783.1 SDR family oxidoreductase [Tardiphaga sp. P9-11]